MYLWGVAVQKRLLTFSLMRVCAIRARCVILSTSLLPDAELLLLSLRAAVLSLAIQLPFPQQQLLLFERYQRMLPPETLTHPHQCRCHIGDGLG